MTRLVYYMKERQDFKNAFEKKMSINEAEIVFAKLVKHYKFGRSVTLTWTSGSRHPKAFCGIFSRIVLNIDCNSFGVLCHELAHIKYYKKFRKGGHNKRHFKIMKGMIAYCERKNWFEDELKRRLAPKPIKPEPTKDELQQQKIAKAEVKVKRYKMKIKMYQKKLIKTERILIRLRKRGGSFSNQKNQK